MPLSTAAFTLGLVAYSVAATLFFVELARRDAAPQATRLAPVLLGVGALLHATHVVAASLITNVCPISSLHFALSLSALIAVAVYLAVRRRARLHALGAFVAPLGLTFLVGAEFVGTSSPGAASLPRGLLFLHIAANLLGVGLFMLAAAAGAFYLLQERRLKEKRHPALGGRLPPLDSLDRAQHRLLLAGFPLLTFGIASGAVFASQLGQAGGAALARAVFGYATWGLLAAVLLLRAIGGWRGRRAAWGTLAGAASLLVVVLVYVARDAALGGGP